MAYLKDLNTGKFCYLHPLHQFGRLEYAVETLVALPQVSKHHASIEFSANGWFITDFSLNGTWVNQTRLSKNQAFELSLGDKIGFADGSNYSFSVEDLSEPCDQLICISAMSTAPINLSRYHLLPNEAQPEMVIFMDENERWNIETLTANNLSSVLGQAKTINDQAVLHMGGQSWRLRLCRRECETVAIPSIKKPLMDESLEFIFNLSSDEEQTSLNIQYGDRVIDLASRSHHYLTVNLARARVADHQRGMAEPLQGWVYPEQLAKELGIDVCHLNIQIHRARKQLVTQLDGIFNSEHIIERKGGRVRFGDCHFRIFKANILESQLPSVIAND